MYAAFYFESLHEGRFETQVHAVRDEQDAYDLREELGQPELMGVYPTEQKALDVCHVREQYEGGFAGEKTIRDKTLVLAASGHKQSAETLEHCGVTIMNASGDIKSKGAVFNGFVAQVQKLGDSNG